MSKHQFETSNIYKVLFTSHNIWQFAIQHQPLASECQTHPRFHYFANKLDDELGQTGLCNLYCCSNLVVRLPGNKNRID